MKKLAPLILVCLSVILFLVLMGTNDAAQLGPGAFFNISTPFLLLYGLCSIAFKKYRVATSIGSYAVLFFLVMTPCLRIFAYFNHSLLTVSPKVGGKVLFVIAIVDVMIGYYLPWGRGKKKGRQKGSGCE